MASIVRLRDSDRRTGRIDVDRCAVGQVGHKALRCRGAFAIIERRADSMRAEQTTSYQLQRQLEHHQSMRMSWCYASIASLIDPQWRHASVKSSIVAPRAHLPCIVHERLARFSELPVNMSAWITVVSGPGTARPIEWRWLANLFVIKHGVDAAWQRVICARRKLYSWSVDCATCKLGRSMLIFPDDLATRMMETTLAPYDRVDDQQPHRKQQRLSSWRYEASRCALTLSPPITLRLYALPYWYNSHF